MPRRDPQSYTDLDQGRMSRLELDLEVDFFSKRLHGRATLHLDEPGGGPLDLDTRELTIESVRTDDGRDAAFTLSPAEEIFGSRLRVERPEGTKTLEIRYATAPSASALQWLDPAQTAGGKHPYLFSQCQAIHARSMAPLQDSPQVRFPYRASITVPDPLVAVMSAAPGEKKPGARPGTTTIGFEMPQPIPAYLLALAVGNIASRDVGPRSRVYTEPEMLDAAAWEFAKVDEMLTAAEELFGPYLWDRFDFLVMPPSFPYGGMENPRLTFLTPTLIAGDRSLVAVLAHELAHSWTGNLVTNASMDHFWLNEGWTVWAERRILEKMEGAETVAFAASIHRHDLDRDMERFTDRPELTWLENDLTGMDPDEVYSLVPYEKGCLFLTLLERTAGREAWDRLVRSYIDRFKFTSIVTSDFEAFVESEMPGLLAKAGAESWIRGPGLPENCPAFRSERLEEIQALAAGWKDGKRPADDVKLSWSADDWQVYLRELPRPLDTSDLRWLDETFGLTGSGNCEILLQWLLIAATSSYEAAYPTIREFLGRYGRMKYLKPLYTALHGNEATRAMAREIFEASGKAYHPIARGGIERILAG